MGAMTHIVWDSFTHAHGWIVQRVPMLNLAIIKTTQGTLRVYKVLQHGSTLVGAVLLCHWYIRWYKRTPAQPEVQKFPWTETTKLIIAILIGLGAITLAIVYSLIGTPSLSDIDSFRQFVGRAVVTSISIGVVEFIIFSACWHLSVLRSQRY
jgi:hypothetical protein